MSRCYQKGDYMENLRRKGGQHGQTGANNMEEKHFSGNEKMAT